MHGSSRCGGRFRLLFGLASLLVMAGGCGDSVSSVKEYVVEVAEGVGEGIRTNAGSLAEALHRLWREIVPEYDGRVRIDPRNPQRGQLEGELRIAVIVKGPGNRRDRIELILTDPQMCRDSESDRWEPCPEEWSGSRQPIDHGP